MKINAIVADVESNVKFNDVTPMTVDTEALEHIMSVLTNLYSDVEAAVFREVLSNAIDAHVESGQIRPIEVTLPSSLSPTFIVKDYGTGMSKLLMQEVFSKYGASTKRGSNAQMGGFGLGAKAPLALTPQFTLYSTYEGVKYTVLISLNEKNIGVLNFVSEVTTTEPNGVEFRIPIDNVSRFVEKAPNILLACDPDQVVVDGQRIKNSIFDKTQWVNVAGNGWFNIKEFMSAGSLYSNYGARPKVKIGSVIYDITEDSVLRRWSNAVINKVGRMSVVSVNIGDVDLVPSRDNLKYSPRTIKAIQDAYGKFAEALNDTLSDAMQELTNRADVLCFYNNATQIGFDISNEWNGEWIDHNFDNVNNDVYLIATSNGHKTTSDTPRTLNIAHMATTTFGTKLRLVSYTDPADLALISKNLKDFMKSESVRETRVLAFPATSKANKWIQAITEHATVDEIKNAALEYRRDIRQNTVKRASTGGVAVSYYMADLSTYDGNDNKYRTVMKSPLANIIDDTYYLYADENNSVVTVTNSVMAGHGSSDFFRGLYSLGLTTGQVVIIPATISFDRFNKYRPNAIDLVEVIRKKATEIVKKLTKDERTYLYSKSVGGQSELSQVSSPIFVSGRISEIVNAETRKFIEFDVSSDIQNKVKKITSNNDVRRIANWSKLLKETGINGTGINDLSNDKKYPLIVNNYHASTLPVDHLIGYLNMADAL